MAATRAGAEDLRAGIAALGTRLSAIRLRRSEDGRVVAGVCSGLARTLQVDVTLVRLVFALLALAGGSGIVLYFAAWILVPDESGARTRKPLVGGVLLVVAILLGVRGLGLDDSLLWPAALLTLGLVLVSQISLPFARWRSSALRTITGVMLIVVGFSIFVSYGEPAAGGSLVAPGAVVAALLLIVAPWLWRLTREREAERTERIRTQERAEMAARVHDSVLQTLALIQREAGDARRVGTLARRQERELRSWLYREQGTVEGESLVASIEAAAAEIEELHGLRVEVVASGDIPLDERLRALVLATREAMANAAKFSGADEVSVYAEVADGGATVFVRDRGAGFDRATVPPDRRGLTESIEGRLARHGGAARIASVLGEGTEVELVVPRRGA
jgi:signal transduction histidine kinase